MARTPVRGTARAAVVLLVPVGLLFTACAGPAAPPVDPSVPVPTVVATPDQYQSLLGGIDRDLGDALARVGAARDADEAEQALLTAASVTSAAGDRLHRQRVDYAVQGAHSTLTHALEVFAHELAYLAQQVHAHAVCTGPAAAAQLRQAPSMPALRAVAAGFAEPGQDGRRYRWGAGLPAADAPDPPVAALAHGALLIDRRAPATGEGVLDARNDGDGDAVVTLGRAGAAVLSVVVGAGRSARVQSVPDGEYELSYTTGRDWDPGLGAFARDCSYRRFTAPAAFTTSPVPGGVDYTVRSVVVRPGPPDGDSAEVAARDLPR
jgi:hypothetical protein